MSKVWLGLLILLLGADTGVLIGFRQVVRGTNLFVTTGTVFYPLIVFNVAAALLAVAVLARSLRTNR
jgi:hypothetical protein